MATHCGTRLSTIDSVAYNRLRSSWVPEGSCEVTTRCAVHAPATQPLRPLSMSLRGTALDAQVSCDTGATLAALSTSEPTPSPPTPPRLSTERRHWSKHPTRRAASAAVNTIGGLSLITLWRGPSVLTRMWCSSHIMLATADAVAAAGAFVRRLRTSSTPRNKPTPRTCPMRGCLATNAVRSRSSSCPTFNAFACNFSSRMT